MYKALDYPQSRSVTVQAKTLICVQIPFRISIYDACVLNVSLIYGYNINGFDDLQKWSNTGLSHFDSLTQHCHCYSLFVFAFELGLGLVWGRGTGLENVGLNSGRNSKI